jgi:hypothetical protein
MLHHCDAKQDGLQLDAAIPTAALLGRESANGSIAARWRRRGPGPVLAIRRPQSAFWKLLSIASPKK